MELPVSTLGRPEPYPFSHFNLVEKRTNILEILASQQSKIGWSITVSSVLMLCITTYIVNWTFNFQLNTEYLNCNLYPREIIVNTVSTVYVYGLTLSLVSLVSREKKERAVLYHPYDNRLGFAIFKSQCPKGSRNFSFLPSSYVAVPNSIFHLLTKIISFV